MPTATVKKPSTAGAAAVDLTTLTHLNNHPALAPLLTRRRILRDRLVAIGAEVTTHRRSLSAAQHADDFSAIVERRRVEDSMTALEREGATVEVELRTVQQEYEATETQVKGEILPILAREGHTVVTTLLDAFTRLQEAAAAYEAYGQRCQHVYGSRLASTVYGFFHLPNCLRLAQHDLERFERLAAGAGPGGPAAPGEVRHAP